MKAEPLTAEPLVNWRGKSRLEEVDLAEVIGVAEMIGVADGAAERQPVGALAASDRPPLNAAGGRPLMCSPAPSGHHVSAGDATLPDMVDIAAVSVVSSAVVALGTIGATIFSGERQRAHEAALDFESRVWDRKSEALFTVIEECRKVADSDEPVTDDNRLTYAKNLSKVLDKLHASRATVEAFASSRCREELTGLIEALRASGVKEYVGRQIDVYWEQIMEADPSDDYRAWNRLTEWRKASEERAVADFDVDLPDLRARASRLLEGARESVRRPKD